MSWVTAAQGGSRALSVPTNLDEITDEEFLRQLWQQAEDFSDRRRIRARMYKLREERLREMVQNDEENLGALTCQAATEGDYERSETDTRHETERKSSIEVKMIMKGDSAITDSVTMQNVSRGGITMRGVGGGRKTTSSDEEIIEEQIKEVSKGRGTRYQQIKSNYDKKGGDSISKTSYSIQSNALSGDSYQSMKHKEVRDSVSPVRGAFDRNRMSGEDSETFFTSDDEVITKSESAVICHKVSSDESSRVAQSKSDTIVKKESPKKITERKISKDLTSNLNKRPEKSSPTSPTRRYTSDTKPAKKQTPTLREAQTSPTRIDAGKKSPAVTGPRTPNTKKTKLDQIAKQMDASLKNEYKRLDAYINESIDKNDEIIMEEEEEAFDEDGNVVKMIVQTRKNKDGTECTTRRVARSTKVVDKESEIDEILIGNPDHEVLDRNVEEMEEDDGSKIKIITETRRRPDGIEYTTKNVLQTSKIFDYDHPEDISYCDHDELISSEEFQETDEHGITIRTVTETRRKQDGTEYITKKVFKTSKVDVNITPSDDDEILDSKETEEKQSDGTIIKTIIERRRTKDGHEYTHRQIFRSRKVTLSSIEYDKGMPEIDNDDEIIDKKEKQELDENKSKVKVVTETRRRKDGSTYSFHYVLRSFKGTEKDIKNMPIKAGSSSNIAVSENDKLLKEDIKEELQKDGSTVKTITERRKAKDGTEYLRHRIMRIPKLPEPELQVGSLDDEVLEEDFKEKVLEDGTHCRAITERRRSSVTGAQYTLRRMSKVYQHHAQVVEGDDEIIDENVTEEETSTGIVIKTVIRRYERPDGTFYTTHDIQKSYRNPVSVSIEVNEDDELVDRSYDERETNDGYIIKTIVETRTRTDGTHYTVERTEKVSKLADNVQVSFRGNSIIVGSPGDKIISSEEHEEPSVFGTVMKTIVEVRQRADGTQYTNKTTIKSTQLLVPEHETSYVVIKADTRNGEEELDFFPSLEDEIVYTRKKNEVDEKGNSITIVIETRKNNKSGELYNLTKKVHTTDVVMTAEGEKIFTNKRPVMKKPTNEEETDVPFGSVSALKSRFVPVNKKDTVKSGKVAIDRTNTANKKMFFEEAAAKTLSTKTSTLKPSTLERNQPKAPTPSYDRKNKDKSDDSSPETIETSRSSSPVKSKEPEEYSVSKPLRNSLPLKKISSPESSDTDSPRIKPIKSEKKPVLMSHRKEKPSRIVDKPSSPKSDLRTKKDISPKKDKPQFTSVKSAEISKAKGRSSDSSPEVRYPGSKSPTKHPVRSLKGRNESPIKSPSDSKPTRVTQSPVSSSPRRGRSPLRSGTSTPREGTPSGRQCCKHAPELESGDPTPAQIKSSPVLRKKPSDDKIIVNREKRVPTKPAKESPSIVDDLSRPKRITQERSTKKPTNEVVRKSASPRIERPSTISKTPEKRVSPLKTVDKHPEKKVESKSPFLKVDSKDPIISMPQTPMTEEIKTYPSTTTPYIEDVSMEPDLPYQSVHRPSLVREPSEHPSTDKYGFEEYEAEQKSKVDKETKSYKPFEPKLNDKPKPEKFSDTSEDDSKKTSPSRYYSPTSRKPFDRTSKSPEKYEPSKLSSEFSKKTPRDAKLNGYNKTDSEDELTVGSKNKFSERVTKIENAAESLVDQIIPDVVEKKFATCKYTPEADQKIRPVSIRQSLFEKSTRVPESSAPSSYKKEPLVPVVEPLIEKRSVHRLGTDDESDTESRSKVERDVNKLTSTRLVMDVMSDTKQTNVEQDFQYKKEEIDVVAPLRDRSMSPLSSYSRPRSKEGSPSPFMKEDSPSRFATGRPIDEGANISKIKRLERSHSNKKIIYEDLEAESSRLPGYLVDIEYITDITVLETLLQKAESYEERRVIRGHIRNLKKTDTNFRTPSSSPAPYKRFVDSTTPSRPSPTSSPLLTRRTPVTTTSSTTKPATSYGQSKDVSETTRKSYTRGNYETSRKSSFEETSTRKVSSEETWTSRKSSREETIRKSSREETSRVTSLDTSRRAPKEDSTPTRKPSDEGPKLVRRVSKEETKPGRKSSTEEESKPKKNYSFDFNSKPRRSSTDEDTKPKRKSSTDDDLKSKRKPSTEDEYKPKRKPSTDDDLKPKQKPSTENDLILKRKSSTDDKLKPLRKTSAEVDHKPKRQSSTEDENIPKRKTSQNETLTSKRKTPEREVKIKRMPSTEEDSKITRKRFDENRKISTEETNKFTRKISGDDKKYIKRQTSGESPSGRKTSGEEPKPTRRPYAFDDEPTKSPVGDVRSSYSRSTAASKKVESVVETNKFTRKTSNEKMPSHVKESSPVEAGKRELFQKEKREPKTPSRFGQEVPKDQPSTFTSRFNRGKPTTTLEDKKKPKPTPEDSFVEPLRHQRNQNRAPIQQQTDMEKIVSPYGVGPTDENGLPLFGLRALKKRTQPTAPSEKTPEDFFRPKEEEEEFVPSDSQGKPLFGIKAVRKSPPEKTTFTATQVAKETATMNETLHTATSVTEEGYLTQSLVSQPQTFQTEVVTSTNLVSESYPSTDSSSDDSQDAQRNLAERRQRRLKRKVGKRYNRPIYSDEEEENLKNLNKSKSGHLSSDEGHSSELDDGQLSDLHSQGETSPALVKAVHESLRRRHTSSSDSEVEEEKSKNLKDIIKLHESKVADTVKPDSSPKLKPRKVIRDSFEPTNESPEPRTHRTWDLEADFSTPRSDAVGNIIAKHETLTKQEKKLTGILKKTSTSSMTTSKLTSSEQDTDDDDALKRINKSKYTEDDKKFERKTSYTEIKLSSPTRNVSGDVTKPIKKPRDKKPSPGPISTSPVVEQKDTYLDTQVTLKSTSSSIETKTQTDEKFITVKSTKTLTGHDTEITFTPKHKPLSKIKAKVERKDEPSKEFEIGEPKYVTKKYFQIDKKKRPESPARKKGNEEEKGKSPRQSPILSRKPITLEKNQRAFETTKRTNLQDIETSHGSHRESCEFNKRKNLFDKIVTSPISKRQLSPGRKLYTEHTDEEKPKQRDTPITQKHPKSQPNTVPVAKIITPASPKRVSSPTRQDVTKIITTSSPIASTAKKPKEVEILKSTALIRKQDRIHKSRAEADNVTKKSPQQDNNKIKTLQPQSPDLVDAHTKVVRKKPGEIPNKKHPTTEELLSKIRPNVKTTYRNTENKVAISTQGKKETTQSITQEISDKEKHFRIIKKGDLEILKEPCQNVPILEKRIPTQSTVKVKTDEFTEKEKRKSNKDEKTLIHMKATKSDDSEPENRTSSEVESVSSLKVKSNVTGVKTETIRITDQLDKNQTTDAVKEKKPVYVDLKEQIPKKVTKQPFDLQNHKFSSTKQVCTMDETKPVEKIKPSYENDDEKKAKRPDNKLSEPDERQPHYKTCKRKPKLSSETPDSKSDESYPEDERNEKLTSTVERKQRPDSYKAKESPKVFNIKIIELGNETKLTDEIETKTTKAETKTTKKQSLQPWKETKEKRLDTKTDQVPDVTLKNKPLVSSDLSESGPDDTKPKEKSSELIRKLPGSSQGEWKPILSSDETVNVRDGIKPDARTYKVDDKKIYESGQQKLFATDKITQLLSTEKINNLKNVLICEEIKSLKDEDQFKEVELETGQIFNSSLKLKKQSIKSEKKEQDRPKTSKEKSFEPIDNIKPEMKEQDRKNISKDDSFKPMDKAKSEKIGQGMKKTTKEESFEPIDTIKPEKKVQDKKTIRQEECFEPIDKVKPKKIEQVYKKTSKEEHFEAIDNVKPEKKEQDRKNISKDDSFKPLDKAQSEKKGQDMKKTTKEESFEPIDTMKPEKKVQDKATRRQEECFEPTEKVKPKKIEQVYKKTSKEENFETTDNVKPEKKEQDRKKTSKEESFEEVDKFKPENMDQDRNKTVNEESSQPIHKDKPEKKEPALKKASEVELHEPTSKVGSKLTGSVRLKGADDSKIIKSKSKVVDSLLIERELILEKGKQEITSEQSITNRKIDEVSKETIDKQVPETESTGKKSKQDFYQDSKLESELQTSGKHKIVKKDLEKQFPQPIDSLNEAKSEFNDNQDNSIILSKKVNSKTISKSDKITTQSYSEHSSESESTKHSDVTTRKTKRKLYGDQPKEEKTKETDTKDMVSEIHMMATLDTDKIKTEKIDMEVGSVERLSVDAELNLKPTVKKVEVEKDFDRRKAFKKVFTKEQVDSLLNMEPALSRKDTTKNVDIMKDSEEDTCVKSTRQLFGSTDNVKSKELSGEAERLSVKSESNVVTSKRTNLESTEHKSGLSFIERTQLGDEQSKKTQKRQPISPMKAADSTPKSKGKAPSSDIIDTNAQIGSLKKAEKNKLNSLEKQTAADEIKKKSKTSTAEEIESTIKVESKVKTDLKKIEPVRVKKVSHDFAKKPISRVDDEEYTSSDTRKESLKKAHEVDYRKSSDEKRKMEVHSDKKIYHVEPKVDKTIKEFPRNKKSTPESRFSSKSPESDDITLKKKKTSMNRDSSEENITNMLQKKSTDARTSSLQSLSASSTTSSVPGYMRPRGDSRKHSTPERDPQEVEDLLLRSYEYTRCTKRVNKNPVSYDYAYSINTKEAPAGGGSNYSIYFGPRRSVPASEQPKEVESLRRNISGKKVSVPDSYISVTEYPNDSLDKTEPVLERDFPNKYDISHIQSKKHENYDDLYLVEEIPARNTVTRQEPNIRNMGDFEHQPDTSHYLGTKSTSERDDRKDSIKSIASIEQQYEDTLKALDTASDLKPEDKSYLNIKKEYLDKVRSSSTMKTSSETKEQEVYSDSQVQYQDTVRNVSKDVLRKPSVQFREDIEYNDGNEASKEMNVVKKISLGDNLHPNIIITEKNDSTDKDLTSHYITKSNSEKTSDSFKKSTREFDREVDENRKNLLSVDMPTQISKSSDLQEKYKYQVEKNTSKYVKVQDSSYSSRKQNVESSSSKEYSSDYKTQDTAVNKYLPDYDYNKVYASKIIKSKKDSTKAIDQSSSHVEQFQTDNRQRYDTEYSSKFVAPETYSYRTQTIPNQDTQTYVTFDGRTVTRKPQQTHDHSSPFNQKSSTVGLVEHSMHSASSHRDGESRPQVETSPCATVGQEKSATFVRGTSRDEGVNMSLQDNVISGGESRSFLDDQSKVTGISDILSRMGASEAVDHEAKVTSDEQARSLLNKFIGAQVLMTGVESMMANSSQASSQMSRMNNAGNVTVTRELSGQSASRSLKDGNVTENRSKFSTGPQTISYGSSSASPKVEEVLIVKGVNINEVTDDFELNQLLDSCEEYEERRRVRLRLKALMAEKKALQKELGGHEKGDFYSSSKRTPGVTGSKELRSSEGGSSSSSISFSRGSTQVTNQKSNFSSSFSTSQNTSLRTTSDSKGASAFDKFKQLDAGQSRHSTSAKSGPALSGPLFQLSSSLKSSANSIKDIMLTWCQCRTRDYQGVKIENFSTSWNDGLAFCALIHHFYPDSFDFNSLNPNNRRHNFALAFRIADEKAGVYPLLDVDDMVMMQKPDWKSVFTYVQSLYKRLKDE